MNVGVDGDLLADREPGDALARLVDYADDLMSGGQREDSAEVPVMDVPVRAAESDLG